MKIITIAAQKGGAGKTTLAVNLAVAAQAGGIKTALIDLDPQESATAWSERRTAELPHVEPLSARRLSPWINAAEAEGFALAIIDTPPAAGAEAAEAVQRSDMVLIPCRPSLIDLEAIKRTAQLITATGKQAFVDSAGRVEKFQKKFQTNYFGQKEKAEADRKAAIAAAEKKAAEERAAAKAAKAAAAASRPKKPAPKPAAEPAAAAPAAAPAAEGEAKA